MGKSDIPETFTAEYYDEKYFADPVGKTFRNSNGTLEHWGYRNKEGESSGCEPIVQAWKKMFQCKTMLDVGAARGTLIAYARQAGIEAVGFDFSEWSVNEGRYSRCKPEWLRVHDATKLWPYPDKSFDLTVALDLMEHIYLDDLPFVISELHRVSRKWIFLQTAVAGCLTQNSAIFTDSGMKYINQLREGDSVLSMDLNTKQLQLKRISAVADKGEQPVFKITVAGREIEATANHPFLLLEHKKRKYVERWASLGELKVDNLIAIAKTSIDGVPQTMPHIETHARRLNIPEASNKDLLYLLGLYTGDGNYRIRNTHRKDGSPAIGGELKLAIPQGDPARYRAIEVLEKLFHYSPRLDHHGVYMDVLSVSELLRDLGFTVGAYKKNIPQWIFGIPKDQKLAFIEGYVDADGMKVGGQWIIYSVNRKLLEQTSLLAISAGINTSGIFSTKPRNVTFPDGHTVYSQSCYLELYPHGQRTYSSAKDGLTFKSHTNKALGYSRIKKMEPQGKKHVYDITVEGNSNFIANGILVHNSGGLQGRDEEGYVLKKGEPVPIQFEGCAAAGHVTLKKESFWYEKLEHDDWMPRKDMVNWFVSLVDPSTIRNWLLNSIMVWERI